MVPYYIPIAILGMLVGAILTLQDVPDLKVIYAAISLLFLVGGFNTLNGVFDRAIDRVNKPNRPIASGKMSVRMGVLYSMALYIIAIFGAILVNFYFISIVLISILLTALYSIPFVNLRSRFVINTFTGLIFYGFLCPLSGWAIYPYLRMPIEMIIFIFILGAGIAITKDFEDIKGDKMFGIKTIPVVFGESSRKIVSFLLILAFIYLSILALTELIEIKYLWSLMFFPWVLYTIYVMNQGIGKRLYFFKNIMLAISVELFIIALTFV